MRSNENLKMAKKTKNDEFYTQYADIEEEVINYKDKLKGKSIYCNCDSPSSEFVRYFTTNFQTLGIKSITATGYNKGGNGTYYFYDGQKTVNSSLTGEGSFDSQECLDILKNSDIIITNPPFSLFREFMDWIWKGPGLQFLVIGNMNAIAYKEIFPKIKDNWIWTGASPWGNFEFETPDLDDKGNKIKKSVPAIWFTNIEHGRRHQPLYLMTAEENLRFSKHANIKGKTFDEAYPKYINYNAIEVSYTDAIPKDYEGEMGVPISFLDKYCPDQFELLDRCEPALPLDIIKARGETEHKSRQVTINGIQCQKRYHRILIRKKQ